MTVLLKPIDSTAISAISAYQKYLSPRKGFNCAYRVLTGGKSCSERVKESIQQQGINWQEIQNIFGECRQAYLQSQSIEPEGEESAEKEIEDKPEEENTTSTSDKYAEAGCILLQAIAEGTSNAVCTADAFDATICDLAGCDIGGCSW